MGGKEKVGREMNAGRRERDPVDQAATDQCWISGSVCRLQTLNVL